MCWTIQICLCTVPYISDVYSIIIYRGISAPGHGKEVVDGLNAVDKRYIYQLMSNVQLPGSVRFVHILKFALA